MTRLFILIIGSLALFGCALSSPQIQHLQLSAGDAPAGDRDTPVIILDAVEIPYYLQRNGLLRRVGDYTVRYDRIRRWAEPLDLGIQRVLARRLESELSTRQIIRYPDVPRHRDSDWRLRVSVQHFETRGDQVQLSAEARWERTPGAENIEEDTNRETVIEFEQSATLGGDSGEEIAIAMSKLLWDFAAAIKAPLTEQINQDL
jgi:uncharacterized lipoprotein YmbA